MAPHRIPVTTRIITFLVGNSYKPLFAATPKECYNDFEYRKDSCLAGDDCGEQLSKGWRFCPLNNEQRGRNWLGDTHDITNHQSFRTWEETVDLNKQLVYKFVLGRELRSWVYQKIS